MAKGLSNDAAFAVDDNQPAFSPGRNIRGRSRRRTFQLNCLLDERLKEPLRKARFMERKSLGAIIEPLISQYLEENGYL